MQKCTIGLKINEKFKKAANWCHRDLSRLESSLASLDEDEPYYPLIQAKFKYNLRPRKNIKSNSVALISNGGIWGGILDSLSELESELEERKVTGRIKKQSSSIIEIVEREIICYGVALRPISRNERISIINPRYISKSDIKDYIRGDCTKCPYFK